MFPCLQTWLLFPWRRVPFQNNTCESFAWLTFHMSYAERGWQWSCAWGKKDMVTSRNNVVLVVGECNIRLTLLPIFRSSTVGRCLLWSRQLSNGARSSSCPNSGTSRCVHKGAGRGGFEEVQTNPLFSVGMRKFLYSLYSWTKLSIRESRKYVGAVDCRWSAFVKQIIVVRAASFAARSYAWGIFRSWNEPLRSMESCI